MRSSNFRFFAGLGTRTFSRFKEMDACAVALEAAIVRNRVRVRRSIQLCGKRPSQTPRTKCANIGHILPTSSFSPSLILQYTILCNIAFCMMCIFCRQWDAIRTQRRGATWNRFRPHRCRATRSKKLPKLVFMTHATTGKPNARAGHGSGARNTKTACAG